MLPWALFRPTQYKIQGRPCYDIREITGTGGGDIITC